ncbi:MAG: tetratricopeptide repeat protein [Acidobacteriaceae bacterium]|nr:tetratricopeptide repeat protein [Acidobacteriaceae bacterium]
MSLAETLSTAIAHHQAGQMAEAEALYRRILADDPGEPDALHLLGVLAHQVGQTGPAIELIVQAINRRPAVAAYHVNLGEVLRIAGRPEPRRICFRNVLVLDPSAGAALRALASYALIEGKRPAAIQLFRRSLRLAPLDSQTCHDLGLALQIEGDFERAKRSYRQALCLEPAFGSVITNLVVAFQQDRQLTEALTWSRRVVRLDPTPAALGNLGGILCLHDRRRDAVIAMRQALRLEPSFNDTHLNLARTLVELGQLSEARRRYDSVLALDPDHQDARLGRGLCLLRAGDFRRGWADHEIRFKTHAYSFNGRLMDTPRWNGETLSGQTVLLLAEQGVGDTLQFLRYAPLVAARGGRVIVTVQRSLLKLLSGFPGIADLIASDESLPAFDRWLPLLSLPLVFDTTLETIPGTVPYLRADPDAVATWCRRLGGGIRVGLVWAGNPEHLNDCNRSCPVDALAPLLAIPEIRWFSLQKGSRAADLARLGWQDRITDLDPLIGDYADTAAIIANLDLVVSVDTSVAHLTGALGRPGSILLPFIPDWRWMLDRPDNPWYPTLRLFRQPRPGDWAAVVADVGDTLRALGQQ